MNLNDVSFLIKILLGMPFLQTHQDPLNFFAKQFLKYMFYPCFHPWPMTSTSLASPPLFFQSFCFLVKFGGIGSLAPLSV